MKPNAGDSLWKANSESVYIPAKFPLSQASARTNKNVALKSRKNKPLLGLYFSLIKFGATELLSGPHGLFMFRFYSDWKSWSGCWRGARKMFKERKVSPKNLRSAFAALITALAPAAIYFGAARCCKSEARRAKNSPGPAWLHLFSAFKIRSVDHQ